VNPYLLDLDLVSEPGVYFHAFKNMQCFITAVMGTIRKNELKQSGHTSLLTEKITGCCI
jgi:hypothetical protein